MKEVQDVMSCTLVRRHGPIGIVVTKQKRYTFVDRIIPQKVCDHEFVLGVRHSCLIDLCILFVYFIYLILDHNPVVKLYVSQRSNIIFSGD